mgnify:CR=1 FL=1
MGKAIDEQIAILEERIKDKQFEINDAHWTLQHAPQEIVEIKREIERLRGDKT